MTRSHVSEQLIGVLIPPTARRRPPPPAPLQTLPNPVRPTGGRAGLFDVARLDTSGRLSSRALVRALGWPAGQRLDVVAGGHSIHVTTSATGPHAVTARGEVSLPAPARALTGISADEPVLLTADPDGGRLVVHPMAAVAALLADIHNGLSAGRHVG
jgi:hypothetical protein